MVEIIHEREASSSNGGNTFGIVFGILFAVILVLFLFYYFGRGYLQRAQAPQINIPDHVNINVQQQKPGYK